MIAINQRKLTICTKKNPKRNDTTVFVWTKHTCTSDCIMRAAKIATASTFTVVLAMWPAYRAKTIAPKTGRFSTQFACARIERLYQSFPST